MGEDTDDPGADGICQRCDGGGCEACSARHLPVGEPENITLELHIRLNGQRWTLVADEIIAAAAQLGVTVVESRLSRCLDDSASKGDDG